MIEVGEHVRFKNGKIRKAIGRDIDGHLLVDIYIYGSNWLTFNEEADILKHSKNIIDLIEIGDYVNGEKINSFRTYDNKKHAVVENSEDQLEYCFDNEDIKSILTKEQYNQNCYRLEN